MLSDQLLSKIRFLTYLPTEVLGTRSISCMSNPRYKLRRSVFLTNQKKRKKKSKKEIERRYLDSNLRAKG